MSEDGVLTLPDPVAPGVVYWVTGLSGAGKTTLAGALADRLVVRRRAVVRLDGDRVRAILGAHSYELSDRKALAQIYANFCREFAGQGFDVVCATVSMFHAVRAWNRANIVRYVEIYLRTPIPVLAARHPKGLYGKGLSGRRNVVGVDLAFEEPQTPDLVIEDDGSKLPSRVAAELFQFLHLHEEAA